MFGMDASALREVLQMIMQGQQQPQPTVSGGLSNPATFSTNTGGSPFDQFADPTRPKPPPEIPFRPYHPPPSNDLQPPMGPRGTTGIQNAFDANRAGQGITPVSPGLQGGLNSLQPPGSIFGQGHPAYRANTQMPQTVGGMPFAPYKQGQ